MSLAAILLLVAAGDRTDLVLEETFSGLASERSFSPISVLLRNDGGEPFDAEVALVPSASDSIGGPQADIVRDVYLSPGESRWVTFTPFVVREDANYALRWADGEADLPPTKAKTRRAVFVGPEFSRAKLPLVRDRFLPTRSTAMDGLRTVVLSEEAVLQPEQEIALRQWVFRGGTLVRSSSSPPRGGELAFSDRPEAASNFGAGVVLRVAAGTSSVTEETLRTTQRLTTRLDTVDLQLEEAGRKLRRRDYWFDADWEIMSTLSLLSTPQSLRYGLPLLIALHVAAVWAIGRVARSRGLPSWAVVVLLTTVGLAAVYAIDVTSPLSGPEGSVVTTIAVARPLAPPEPGEEDDDPSVAHDIRQWAIARDRDGRDLTLDADAEHGLVSVETGGVRGVASDGPSQSVRVSMAPKSNVRIRARGIRAVPPPDVRVVEFASLRRLRLGDAAQDGRLRFRFGIAQYRGQMIRLDPYLRSTGGVNSFAHYMGNSTLNTGWSPRILPGGPRKESMQVAAALGLLAVSSPAGKVEPIDMTLPPGQLRVLLVEDLPPEADLLSQVPGGDRLIAWVLDFRVTPTQRTGGGGTP